MVDLTNIVIADIDGYHDDGWCAPFVRGRLIAPIGGQGIAIGCWLAPDAEQRHETFMLRLPSLPLIHCTARSGDSVDLVAETPLHTGQEISFSLNCTSNVKSDIDKRPLSFILTSIKAL